MQLGGGQLFISLPTLLLHGHMSSCKACLASPNCHTNHIATYKYMLQVPLGQPGELKKIICWEFEGTAFDQGDDAASWFTKYLGSPHRLVRYAGKLVIVESRLTECFSDMHRRDSCYFSWQQPSIRHVDRLQLLVYHAHR